MWSLEKCYILVVISCKLFWAQIMLDSVDAKDVDKLSMTSILLVALSPLLLKDDDFLSLRVLLDSGIDASVSYGWSSYSCVLCGADHEYIVEADLLTDFEWNLFYQDFVILSYFVL